MSTRRCQRVAACGPHAPALQAPGTEVAPTARGSEGAADAILDPATRTYYDPATGTLLADLTAWDRAAEPERERARARLAAVQRAEDAIALGIPRLAADRQAAEEACVAASVVGNWRRKVRRLPEGARVAALLDAPRTGRPSAIDDAMRDELESLIFHFGVHLTAKQARRALMTRHGRAPALSTIRAWLARWRIENAGALSAVTNPDRHRSHRQPAGGDASANVHRLNQLWELDSTPADVMCADGKRYAIVAALDVWSRRGRVLVAPTSRASAIAALLRRCILDWGVPEIVRTDEGRDYTSRHVLGVLADLEIEHDPCPPYTPEAKPHVERFLGTMARDLFAFLPGFTGHDVVGAAALRARKSFAERRRAKGARSDGRKAPAETFAVALTAEQLQDYCDHWCEAVYGCEPHAGLGGVSPANRARSSAEPVRRVHDERALDALLAEPAGDGWRTVGKKGIRLDNVNYIAGDLGPLVRERVRVRRDPADLDRIHVYRRDGTFVCVAEDPARTGADRTAIAAQMKARAGEADRKARKRARALTKRHRPERVMDDVLAKALEESDRVVALPRKAEAHETPALSEAAKAAKAASEGPRKRAAKPSLAATALRLFQEEHDEWAT